jgi:predicted MPP superfamily phosphohydrolase
MTLRSIFPLIILLIFVYVVFVFPFEIIATWLGHPGGTLELIISTLVIYLICLFYLRTKNSNKLLKFLVYEGVGVGSISLFIIIPILFLDILFLIPNNIKITIFFFFQIPLLIFGLFNARKIKIKKLEISSNTIDSNLSFVFISDVHIGSNSPKRLEKIIPMINQLNPKFLLIGGDLIDSSSFKIEDLSSMIKIKCPIYFVTGNHEYYIQNFQHHLDNFHKYNIRILNNEAVIHEGINLIGINDNLTIEQKKTIYIDLSKKNKFNLLAVHQPSLWKLVKNDVDLMLSGHTHNGQIFPFNLLVKIKFPQIYGLYQEKNNKLYVSSGISTWGPKIRIGSQNELVHINLNKK